MDNIIGIAYPEWRELRKETNNDIEPQRRAGARRLTIQSVYNTWRGRSEQRRFGTLVEKAVTPAPLFVIGHWRSGTTLLHNLLSQDRQFVYPRIGQVSNPHSFLLLPPDEIMAERLSKSKRKRPMDNVEFDPLSPGEDEFATCPMSIRSHMISWTFLRQEPFYDRFLTFKDANATDRERWLAALRLFLKKLMVRYNGGRPLLKSPQHTARIAMLLKEWPSARFVHIHRDPYVVFNSTRRLYETGILPAAFQSLPHPNFVMDGVIRRYREMYDAFFAERSLIPPGQYCEVAFEELEKDMVGQVAHIYEALRLPDYTAAEPRLRAYAATLQEYKKNKHPEIETALRQRLAQEWEQSFAEWSYPV